MRSILRSSFPIVLLAAAGTMTARVAKADPNNPTDNDKAAARPLAIEGLRLAQAGNCREAAEQLERAEALVHAPTTAVPLAQCDIQLGKIIAGTELLERVINETLPPNAPPSFAEAKRQARAFLDAATPKIAKLRIHVDLPPGDTQANLEVTVDGQPVPLVLLDNDRPSDPGKHHIVVRQAGVGSVESDVTLAEGQVSPVSLRLEANGTAGAAPPPPGTTLDPYGQGVVAVPPPPVAEASGAPWMAFEFGARLAFGLPFGNSIGGNGNDLNHIVSNQIIPLWLDAGLRFASHWYVGAYFSFGVASLSGQFSNGLCNDTGVGCSGNDTRLGVNAHYHVLPDGFVDPWFGVGFGYEWLSGSVSADAAATTTGTAETLSSGADGWEFVNLQGGVDFHLLNGALAIGPTVTLTIDQFDHQSVATNGNGGTQGASIQNQALHQWLLLGVRGSYDLKFH